jgi:DNA polymerase alpha subunit A
VEVGNIPRRVQVAPRVAIHKEQLKVRDESAEEKQRVQRLRDDMKAIQEEVIQTAKNTFKVLHIKSQWAERTYSMDVAGVPRDAKILFLELEYPANEPPLPRDFSGETFSGAFGTGSSPLELFILQKKLMGPCWLSVRNVKNNSIALSWCKLDLQCASMHDVVIASDVVREPPPLRVLSLAMKTVLNEHTEIVVLSGVFHAQGMREGRRNYY